MRRIACLSPWMVALAELCGACRSDAGSASAVAKDDTDAASFVDATRARPALCDRAGEDAVRDMFCGDEPAQVRSLADLEAGLALVFANADAGAGAPYPDGYLPMTSAAAYAGGSAPALGANTSAASDPFVAMLAHSTALSGHLVTPINPRVLLLKDTIALAFNRGVQQVELASRDRARGDFNFYLVSFEQVCNGAAEGCSTTDLYTPRIESDWTRISLQDDEELKNSPSDCRQCHRRGGDKSALLMRELNGPWTHFFDVERDAHYEFGEPTGGDLTRDFVAAKGDEAYAGVAMRQLRAAQSFNLRNFVDYGQPLVFDSLKILNERWPKGPEGYASEPQRSATWEAGYGAFKRGEQLPLPYYAPRATDPEKQAQLTAAYRSYLAGDRDTVPELADIYPDDPSARAELGLQVEPDASPVDALIQACASCHNDVLDQQLSRARFNVALAQLDRAELDIAVARLEAPRDSAAAMPPKGARQLDADSLAALIAYLARAERPSDDEARLAHAARSGMAGTH